MRSRFATASARTLLLIVGMSAVAWGAGTLPDFRQQFPVEDAARRVTGGEPFSRQALAALTPAIQRIEQSDYCRPAALRAVAIIRLRLAEDAFSSSEQSRIDDALKAVRTAIRRSLSCAPADPFLWLTLYWVENTYEGFDPGHFGYLRMSYALGPNEGWIAVKRNRFGLAVFERLPPDLAEMTLREFVSLVDGGFVRDAAAIFAGPGWRIRDRILPRLEQVSDANRKDFAKALYDGGYNVDVPGTERPDPRPWH